MKNRVQSLILIAAFVVPLFLLLRNIFFLGSQSWGDAPHFWASEVKELFSEPSAWTQRGINFGGVNLLLWISPLMFLLGVLGKCFSLTSDILVNLVFYLPGVTLAAAGAYSFAKSQKLTNIASFFAGITYTFSTYFFLAIDGGQVGIVLAYGLFPFSLLFLKKFISKPTLNGF